MSRFIPYPLMAVALLIMWLLLQQSLSLGTFLLGAVISLFACWAVAALEPDRPKVRRPWLFVKLFFVVALDVLHSNIAVTRIVLAGRRRPSTSNFVTIPLELTDRTGLTLLACIVTATPGSAWLEYDTADSSVLIHVLDLPDPQAWSNMLKTRYESLLLEIFQ